ncbi:MAG: septum formation protein Maf [Ruminococcaceae bacterium]|nr:septum formation protein Maf [Oscillospiraceae bacterium]
MQLILASASPRRREICGLLGIDIEVMPAAAEPPFDPALSVEDNALAVSRAKAREVASRLTTDLPILGADTSVILDTENGATVLGKPRDEEDAFRMLQALQGRSHRVITGVWVCQGERENGFVDQATVHFAPMTDEEIRAYIATGESMDKAGAYAVQGRCLRHINGIEGDFYTVMGLPSASLWRFLCDF